MEHQWGLLDTEEARLEARLRWWDNLAGKQVQPLEWREFEQGDEEETASEHERMEMEQQWLQEQALTQE